MILYIVQEHVFVQYIEERCDVMKPLKPGTDNQPEGTYV